MVHVPGLGPVLVLLELELVLVLVLLVLLEPELELEPVLVLVLELELVLIVPMLENLLISFQASSEECHEDCGGVNLPLEHLGCQACRDDREPHRSRTRAWVRP